MRNLLKNGGQAVCLIKPQFEAGKEKVGKKGVVREKRTHLEVIHKVIDFGSDFPLDALGLQGLVIDGNIDLHLTLFLFLALVFYVSNTLVGNMINHHSCGLFHLGLFIFPISTGAVLHSPDDAGNGDLESCQQHQQRLARFAHTSASRV